MSNKKIILLACGGFSLAVTLAVGYIWLNKFKLSETGTIGDGFNGLLAPFISFAGALLVYLSFREQTKANNMQVEDAKIQHAANEMLQSQWQFDTFTRMFNETEARFKSLSLTELVYNERESRHDSVIYKAGGALLKIRVRIENATNLGFEETNSYSEINDITFLMFDLSQLLKFLRDTPSPNRFYFLSRVMFFFKHNVEKEIKDIYDLMKGNSTYDHFTQTYLLLYHYVDFLRLQHPNDEVFKP